MDRSIEDSAPDTEAQQDLAVARCALYRLGHRWRTPPSTARPLIVQASATQVEVLLDVPVADEPEGWVTGADARILSSTPATTSRCTGYAVPRTLMLVPIGDRDEAGQVFLDLEAEPVIELAGPADQVERLSRHFVESLVAEGGTGGPVVVVVGDRLVSLLGDHVRIEGFDTWDEVESRVLAAAIAGTQTLSSHGWPSTFVGRATQPGHPELRPVCVFVADPLPVGAITVLRACRPSPVSVVSVGTTASGALRILCDAGQVHLPSIGLTCAITPRTSPATSAGEAPPGRSQPNTAAHTNDDLIVLPEDGVLVRLLGDIAVVGGRKPLSSKPTAVVAYVALHREVSADRLADACWRDPDLTDEKRRLRDLVSQCRAAIGSAHLPAATEGHYRAGPALLTDTDLFSSHIERAASMPAVEAAEECRAALDLVRGRIFSYPSRASASFAWIDLENLVNRWEVKIADVAQQCAATFLDIDRAGDAVEVLDHVATALPLHSGLTEMLMRAHGRAGDQRSVRTVYAAYVSALADLELDVEDSVRTTFHSLQGDGGVSAAWSRRG